MTEQTKLELAKQVYNCPNCIPHRDESAVFDNVEICEKHRLLIAKRKREIHGKK